VGITTFDFGIFVGISVVLYYVFPLKQRWLALLLSSGFFVYCANDIGMILVMLGMILLAYSAGRFFGRYGPDAGGRRFLCGAAVFLLAAVLIGLKETNFFIATGNAVHEIIFGEKKYRMLSVAAPLGISYFALTLISYVCDSYWGIIKPEKNPLKFAGYVSFYPLLTSGPILRFGDSGREITEGHKFQYRNLCFGMQRILWGLFKKLVICERAAVLVNAVYENQEQYEGLYVPLAVAAFALQLYTDFSGCIDIMLGVAQLYGITLPENFDLPFVSGSLSEFWRRWHITLGGFLRDYILYPILKSAPMQKLGSVTKKRFGKKIGKKIPTWIGMLISWFLIGFWHGGTYNYIFGVGIFFGLVIVSGEIFAPLLEKIRVLLGIDTERFSWKLFQAVRTFCIFSFGLSFFRADGIQDGWALWGRAFAEWNPWIFFDGSLYRMGLDEKDFRVLIVMLFLMAAVAVLRLWLKRPIREWLAEQGVIFRWSVSICLLFCIVIFGKYGPGYDASAFIYGKF